MYCIYKFYLTFGPNFVSLTGPFLGIEPLLSSEADSILLLESVFSSLRSDGGEGGGGGRGGGIRGGGGTGGGEGDVEWFSFFVSNNGFLLMSLPLLGEERSSLAFRGDTIWEEVFSSFFCNLFATEVTPRGRHGLDSGVTAGAEVFVVVVFVAFTGVGVGQNESAASSLPFDPEFDPRFDPESGFAAEFSGFDADFFG